MQIKKLYQVKFVIGTKSMKNKISIQKAKIIWQPWSQSDSSGNLYFNIAFRKAIPLDLLYNTHSGCTKHSGPMVPYNMDAPSGDWSTEIERVLLSDHCSTSKSPRL